MDNAKITFSNNEVLNIKIDDYITPIVSIESDKLSASMDKAITIEDHIHDGLIPSLMHAFCNCDYFYLNNNHDVVYCAKAIVKIERY